MDDLYGFNDTPGDLDFRVETDKPVLWIDDTWLSELRWALARDMADTLHSAIVYGSEDFVEIVGGNYDTA